jgi:hypothetical protein
MEEETITYDYVYIIHLRQFVDQKQPVYKVGMTKQKNFDRFKQYPKGSKVIAMSHCSNSRMVEAIMLSEFSQKYKVRHDHGSEYFEGDIYSMLLDFNEILTKDHNGKKGSTQTNTENPNLVFVFEQVAQAHQLQKEKLIAKEDELNRYYNEQNYYLNKNVEEAMKKIERERKENKILCIEPLEKMKKECDKLLKIIEVQNERNIEDEKTINNQHIAFMEQNARANTAIQLCIELIKKNNTASDDIEILNKLCNQIPSENSYTFFNNKINSLNEEITKKNDEIKNTEDIFSKAVENLEVSTENTAKLIDKYEVIEVMCKNAQQHVSELLYINKDLNKIIEKLEQSLTKSELQVNMLKTKYREVLEQLKKFS